MENINSFSKQIAAAVLLSAMSIASVQAIPSGLAGEVSFSGAASTDTGDLGTATTLIFGSNVEVDDSTVDYAADGITTGDAVTMTSLNFASFTPPETFWTIAGTETNSGSSYNFVIETLNIDFQSSNFLLLSGTGLGSCSSCGRSPQDGTWTISADGTSTTRLWKQR